MHTEMQSVVRPLRGGVDRNPIPRGFGVPKQSVLNNAVMPRPASEVVC